MKITVIKKSNGKVKDNQRGLPLDHRRPASSQEVARFHSFDEFPFWFGART